MTIQQNWLLLGGPAHQQAIWSNSTTEVTIREQGKDYLYKRERFIFDGKHYAVGVHGLADLTFMGTAFLIKKLCIQQINTL